MNRKIPGHKSTVLVTGGAGFIGSHLVDYILSNDFAGRVRVVDDLSTGSLDNLKHLSGDPRLDVIEGSAADEELMRQSARSCDLVFHLASSVGVREVMAHRMKMLQSGAKSVMALLDACHIERIPMIFTSTSEVYGDTATAPLHESLQPAPGPPEIDRWGYAAMKLFGEYCVLAQHRERKSPGLVIRLFNTVGPRQSPRFGMVLPRFIEASLAGRPIEVHGDGTQRRCFGYVADVVESIIQLSSNTDAFGTIINVGGTQEISINDLALSVIEITQSKSTIQYVPHREIYGASFQDIRQRIPDVSRLVGLTGLSPQTPIEDIIRLTAESMGRRAS